MFKEPQDATFCFVYFPLFLKVNINSVIDHPLGLCFIIIVIFVLLDQKTEQEFSHEMNQ